MPEHVNPDKNIEELITPAEAGEFLKVKETTIKKWLRNGSLKGYKIGSSNGEWRTTKKACIDLCIKGKNY